MSMDGHYPCCGKSICQGCEHTFCESGNMGKCPFCNSNRNKTKECCVEDLMKRAAVNDAVAICVLVNYYFNGERGIPQDHTKGMERRYEEGQVPLQDRGNGRA